MQRRIYLASPYTSTDARLREARYWAACSAAALVMEKGDLVFSPIAHSHPLAKFHELPVDFDFWQSWCLSFLRNWATHFTILDIPGWDESKGIAAEKALADSLGLPVIPWHEFLEQEDE